MTLQHDAIARTKVAESHVLSIAMNDRNVVDDHSELLLPGSLNREAV